MKEIINTLKNNKELNERLQEGVEFDSYYNDNQLLIKIRIPFEVCTEDFLGRGTLNKVHETIINTGNFKLISSETLESFNKCYSYMVEYAIK